MKLTVDDDDAVEAPEVLFALFFRWLSLFPSFLQRRPTQSTSGRRKSGDSSKKAPTIELKPVEEGELSLFFSHSRPSASPPAGGLTDWLGQR
jgi:hypothetical protein